MPVELSLDCVGNLTTTGGAEIPDICRAVLAKREEQRRRRPADADQGGADGDGSGHGNLNRWGVMARLSGSSRSISAGIWRGGWCRSRKIIAREQRSLPAGCHPKHPTCWRLKCQPCEFVVLHSNRAEMNRACLRWFAIAERGRTLGFVFFAELVAQPRSPILQCTGIVTKFDRIGAPLDRELSLLQRANYHWYVRGLFAMESAQTASCPQAQCA